MMESSSRRQRFANKLFGNRDRKASNEANDDNVMDFLNNPGDRLTVSHDAPHPPPQLKLNTAQAPRYPGALQVGQNLPLRQPSNASYHPPRRTKKKKGLNVRFAETYPEVIGEGGDESELPTIEISKRKNSAHFTPMTAPPQSTVPKSFPERKSESDFAPTALRRTQTGFSDVPEPTDDIPEPPAAAVSSPPRIPRSLSAREPTKEEHRRSFIELHRAGMREAEGMAFAQAARTVSSGSQREWEETKHSPSVQPPIPSPLPPSSSPLPPPPAAQPSGQPPPPPPHASKSTPQAHAVRPSLDHSPASLRSMNSLSYSASTSRYPLGRGNGSPPSPTKKPVQSGGPLNLHQKAPSFSLHDIVSAASDDALGTFKSRVQHLFELFRLHAETMKPIASSTPEDLARASLWWFIKGRMGLESAVRDRPNGPEAQRQNDNAKQQAYSDLAKSYWLSEEIITEVTGGKWTPTESEVDDIRKSILSNLRKLTMSMKRNGFLPPEEPFLPQIIDKSIWVEYPQIPQDLVSLLSGSGASALSSQKPTAQMDISDALPLGDTTQYFNYGRVAADVYLMERDSNTNQFHFPCYVTIVRPQKQPNPVFVIASQNGVVQLRIQGNKNVGPTWDEVRWRSDNCALEIKLPRGFMLVVQCNQHDYRTLFGHHDFTNKVQSSLYPRSDEQPVFRSTLRGFQYFDSDPSSRTFPKDPVSQCDVALFEKIHKENSPTGPRSFHRGFRIAVVTGPRTKSLAGISHIYPPSLPIQFGFLRGEKDDPALLLKYQNERTKASMVFSFNDEKERFSFHSLLIGSALNHDEQVFAEAGLTAFSIGEKITDNLGIQGFNHLQYKQVRVINDENAGDEPPTVLADKLRIVVDFEHGNITDRVNMAPGEFRLRLDPRVPTGLYILRQPQNDLTVAVSEAQVSKDASRELSQGLEVLKNTQSVRSYRFSNVQDLHNFQAALTGFKVLFDGLAVMFAISRRRMVVPIHKKWEAGETRIQVVQQDKQIQILAFFEDFHHGHCMNFTLKGTDVFESYTRGSKAGLKMIDAKFPLPRMTEDVGEDAAFVCLDMPDFAGEHDDISILFEKASDRDRLIKCLPAPVKGSKAK